MRSLKNDVVKISQQHQQQSQ